MAASEVTLMIAAPGVSRGNVSATSAMGASTLAA